MILNVACHPLIHLAYAYELNNVEVAAEGPPPLPLPLSHIHPPFTPTTYPSLFPQT
jgi:hypothetical protein